MNKQGKGCGHRSAGAAAGAAMGRKPLGVPSWDFHEPTL